MIVFDSPAFRAASGRWVERNPSLCVNFRPFDRFRYALPVYKRRLSGKSSGPRNVRIWRKAVIRVRPRMSAVGRASSAADPPNWVGTSLRGRRSCAVHAPLQPPVQNHDPSNSTEWQVRSGPGGKPAVRLAQGDWPLSTQASRQRCLPGASKADVRQHLQTRRLS